ncbi:hypothetical protein YC2023_084027 [Brassica napus]
MGKPRLGRVVHHPGSGLRSRVHYFLPLEKDLSSNPFYLNQKKMNQTKRILKSCKIQ